MASTSTAAAAAADAAKSEQIKADGNIAFRAGDFEHANALYTRAIALNPTANPILYTNRAQTRVHLRAWEDAALDCNTVLELLGRTGWTGLVPSRPAHSAGPAPAGSTSGAGSSLGSDPAPRPPALPDLSANNQRTLMKAHYLLSQAQLQMPQPEEAYGNALEGYRICMFISGFRDEQGAPVVPALGQGKAPTPSPSLRPLSALVIQTKLARWRARESHRIRNMVNFRSDMERLLKEKATADKNANKEAHRKGKTSFLTYQETGESINSELNDHLSQLADICTKADPKSESRDIPRHLIDPITFEIMHDPVITPSGHSFERASIIEHLSYRQVDPMTSRPMIVTDLRPNIALKDACDEFISNARGWMYSFT